MLVLLDRLGMEHLFFEMLDDVFSRPVFSHEPRFVFPHLPLDLVRDGIDRGIHVVGFFAGLDCDVIRADKDDLGGMPVFLDLEDDVRLDDLGIIEMQALDLAGAIVVDRLGDLEMAAGDFDGWVSVGGYHVFPFAYI
jgi:hypothetical protein